MSGVSRPVWLVVLATFAAGALLGCSSGLKSLQVDVRDGVDQTYAKRGHYRDNQEIRRISSDLPRMRRAVLEHIAARTGMRADHPERLVVMLDDKLPGSVSYNARIDGRVCQIASLKAATLAFKGRDVEKLLTHELTHAVMLQRIVGRPVPRWFGEGMAVWTAGQMERKGIAQMNKALIWGKGMDHFCTGLNAGRHRFDDYMEDGLAFAWLEERIGLDGIHRFVADILNGAHPTRTLARMVELDWPTARRQLKRHCQAFLDSHWADHGYEELLELRRRSQVCLDGLVDQCARTERELQAFIRDRPESVLLAAAWYWVGRLRTQAGDHPGAIQAFQTGLGLQPLFGPLFQARLGAAALRSGDWVLADASFREIELVVRGRRRVILSLLRARALLGLGEREQAIGQAERGLEAPRVYRCHALALLCMARDQAPSPTADPPACRQLAEEFPGASPEDVLRRVPQLDKKLSGLPSD